MSSSSSCPCPGEWRLDPEHLAGAIALPSSMSGGAGSCPCPPCVERTASGLVRDVYIQDPFRGLVKASDCSSSRSSDTAAGEAEVVIVLDAASAYLTPTGSCSPGLGPDCGTRLHLAKIQTYDGTCDEWRDGRCVWVGDIDGRFLQYGKRYFAKFAGIPPGLIAIPLPVGAPCQSAEELYMADAGDPVRVLVLEEQVETLCPESTELDPDLIVCNTEQAELYLARVRTFNADTCTWVQEDEVVYVMEKCGRSLPVEYRLIGEYHTIITASDGCKPLYVIDCPGYTGPETVIISEDCVPPSGTSSCAEGPNAGDRLLRVGSYFYVCGHLVTREVVEYLFECCCSFLCSPGVGTINCAPCDALTPGNRAGTINVTISTMGACMCLEGTYALTGHGDRYEAAIDACENKFYVALVCTDSGWVAIVTCDPCAYDPSPDNPEPPPPCSLVFAATVDDCGKTTFSGEAETSECLTCRIGTCAGFCFISLTFTAP